MFGSPYFGRATFGEPGVSPTAILNATAAIPISVEAPLKAESVFRTFAAIPIGADSTLRAPGPLYAQAILSFDASASSLGVFGRLGATSTIPVATAVATITVSGPLQGAAAIPVSIGSYRQTVLQDGPAAYWRLDEMSAYRNVVLRDGPSAYWRLDETSGTTVASQVGDYNGTIIGGVTRQQPGVADGNTAMAFDGSTGRITVPKAAYSAFGTGPVSWECWIKFAASQAATVWFVDCGVASTNSAGVQFLTDNIGVFAKAAYGTGALQLYSGAITPFVGAWHHVVAVLTRSPDVLTIYVDGVWRNQATMPVQGADVTASQPLSFGTYPGNAGPSNMLNGSLDEVAFYKVALTAAQVAQHYNAASIPFSTSVADSSGNGHTGTVTGGVTFGQQGPLVDSNPAMAFDGTSGQITTEGTFNLPAGYGVEAWIKTTANDQRAYCSTRTVASGGVLFGINGGKAFVYADGATPDPALTGTKPVADGQWHHLVTTYDNTTMRLYVDGALDVEAARTKPASTVAETMFGSPYFGRSTFAQGGVRVLTAPHIGWDAPSNVFFAGAIDEVAIYPFALTPSQVASHYTLRLVGFGAALLASAGFTSTTTIPVAATPRLSTLPATFSGALTIPFDTVGSAVFVGLGFSNVMITWNGVVVTDQIRRGSVTIQDVLNEAPNTCDFICNGTPPPIGTEVKVALANLAPENLLFAGTVRRVDQYYDLKKDNPAWSVSCMDYTLLLNRRKVFGTWTNTSASIVATDILLRFTSGFQSEITPYLPPITLTLSGADVMDALTQVANLIGGYVKPTYRKTVKLFITDPEAPPHPIDGTDPGPLNIPAITESKDETQVRNRVYVQGMASQVVGPSETALPVGAAQIPLEDVAPFSSGQVITDDAQILNYQATAPGGVAAVVVGNVPGPSSSGDPQVAAGVAGHLSGYYQYRVAFASPAGETVAGPPSGQVFCPDFTTPGSGIGIGSGGLGPLVGAYQYRVAFLTTLGETLPGPITARTASGVSGAGITNLVGPGGISRLAPGTYYYAATFVTPYGESLTGGGLGITQQPFVPLIASASFAGRVANSAGPLMPGSSYNYGLSIVSSKGESLAYPIGSYAPASLGAAGWSAGVSAYGGIYGGAYYVGTTIVTRLGEGTLVATGYAGTNQFTGPPSAPSAQGWDTSGRVEPGPTYYWACSAYHETYGETALSGYGSSTSGGSVPLAFIIYVPPTPSGAHGMRLYRASNNTTYKLVTELRGWGGGNLYDRLSTNELGNQYPKVSLRVGVNFVYSIGSSSESDTVARRIYRTKAGGSEYFLVGEAQGNNAFTFTEGLMDTELTQRPPAVLGTGRVCAITGISTGAAGTIARRIYRTKAGGGLMFLVGEIKDNSTTWWDDTVADAALQVAAPGFNTAGSGGNALTQSIPRIKPNAGPSGTAARRIYRTKVNGSEYFLLAELADNNPNSFYDDNKADEELNAQRLPTASTAGGETHALSSIPIGPPGTLARLIYRTKANGGEFYQLARIADNTTTTFTDNILDASLGKGVALVNEAGSSAVNLFNVPIGPAGITQRVIYRTIGGGTDYRYVGTIDNNTATTYFDDKADSALGRPPQATSTIGAIPADTTLVLDSGAASFPSSGWVKADSQYLRYTGKSGNTLTGIPASGPGAITANIRGGSTVTTASMLTGVSGIAVALPVGSSVALWVQCDSLAGQQQLAATEGGDGVHEYVITDSSLDSVAACTKRGQAELTLFEFVQRELTYSTHDRLTRSGAQVTINLPPPQSQSGTFMIQNVRIDEIDLYPRTLPRYTVTASSTKFSLQDLLRHVLIEGA